MILTVTMNPAIDTAYQLDKLVIDDVNRVSPKKTAGGKGLNAVSYTHLDVYKRQGLGRALLGLVINVEESIALVVAVGPAELVLQAPHKVCLLYTSRCV